MPGECEVSKTMTGHPVMEGKIIIQLIPFQGFHVMEHNMKILVLVSRQGNQILQHCAQNH